MPEDRPRRRLAAILVADVVGYSRLMAEDESGTLAALKKHRAILIDPTILGYNGRIVKLLGDGMLAEFASAVDAVQCAVEIQRLMTVQNAEAPQDRKIELRIGINLGDVILDGDDIYGDGVNVAARIETVAKPGEVCISASVYDQIKAKLDYGFENLGPRHLKNIPEPISIYSLVPRNKNESQAIPGDAKLALPDRPSIAVLPFENLSGDIEQEYLADGIVEDIITGLSRISGLFVIARNSSFYYKGKNVDIRQVGSELGVRYVLEGSVRRVGPRVRISVQLIEAATGIHVSADKYDQELADIFDLQDEITKNVVASTQTQVALKEGQRVNQLNRPDLRVWELIKKGWAHLYRLTPETIALSRTCAEEALNIDPNSGQAYQLLSLAIFHDFNLGFYDATERLSLCTDALHYAQQAIRLDDTDEYSHWALGLAHHHLGNLDKSIAAFERALEINPNCSLAEACLGGVLVYAGRPVDGKDRIKVALRSNPRDPSIFYRYAELGLAHYLTGDYEAAVECSEISIRRKPQYYCGHMVRISACVELERDQEVATALQDYLEAYPEMTVTWHESEPFKNQADLDRILIALRKAGLPN